MLSPFSFSLMLAVFPVIAPMSRLALGAPIPFSFPSLAARSPDHHLLWVALSLLVLPSLSVPTPDASLPHTASPDTITSRPRARGLVTHLGPRFSRPIPI